MYSIIAGATDTGLKLATWLIDAGSEVTVIDSLEHRCKSVEEKLGSITIHEDPTVIANLINAGIERADLLLSTLGEDHANLLISSLAKIIFNTPQVISVINVPENSNIFSIMGIDESIEIVTLVSENIEEKIADLLIEEV